MHLCICFVILLKKLSTRLSQEPCFAKAIILTDTDYDYLKSLICQRTLQAQVVDRAKILIYKAQGEANQTLVNYDIVACLSPRGYELHGKDAAYAYGGDYTGITVMCDDIASVDYEDLLVCESVSDYRQVVMPQIRNAAEHGKNIVFMYDVEAEYRKETERLCDINHVKCTAIIRRKMDASKILQNEKDIIRISVPVICVASVIENTNKFEVQLGLRNYLLKEGYKVSQVGSKEYCELFGFHAIPQFMYDHQLSENDKILLFNRVCKSIELQERPDIFIICVPGATMVYNDVITNYWTDNFFGSRLHMLPGDIVAYLYAIEEAFELQVPSSYILDVKFISLDSVTDIIFDILQKNENDDILGC